MTQQTYSLETLVEQTDREPDHKYVSSDGRYVDRYWIIPGTEPDHSGCRPTAKLIVDHDKGRKAYTARLELTTVPLTGWRSVGGQKGRFWAHWNADRSTGLAGWLVRF